MKKKYVTKIRRGMGMLVAAALVLNLASFCSFAAEGQNKSKLPAGEYSIKVKNVTCGAPIPAVKDALATVFGDSVKVKIDEKGNETAYMKNHHMIINFQGDHHANISSIIDADASTPEIEKAEILSTKMEVYTPGLGSKETKNITVPDEFTIPLKLDANGTQKMKVTIDFMDAFMGGGKPMPAGVTFTLDESSRTPVVSPQLPEPPATDVQNLEDGLYDVPVALWHSTQDKASMAADTIDSNAKVLAKDGKIKVTLSTKAMKLGAITACLQELKVISSDGTYKDATVESKDAAGNPTAFSFYIDKAEKFVKVKVNPHVAMMGNRDIDARLKFDFENKTKLTEDVTAPNTEEGSNGGNTSNSDTTIEDGKNDSVDKQQNTVAHNNKEDAPKTSDSNNVFLWLSLIAATLATFAVMKGNIKKVN